MRQTILVTGANGQLGNEIQNISKSFSTYNFLFTDVDTLNITDFGSLDSFFTKNKINIIINCAAYTAVDKAEVETDKATLLNTVAPAHLAEIAVKYKAKLIHISTDYVFDGNNVVPYKEDDPTNPPSAYGLTKLGGETAIKNITNDYIIIRTSWLYSEFGNNFVKTMLRYGKEKDSMNVVYDQVGGPTYARDLADAIIKITCNILENPDSFKSGIYHYANEGVCSWYDFAKEILALASIDCKIHPIETKDYPLPAKRPCYSVFNKAKIKADYNIEIPYWKDSLKECISKLIQNA